MRPTTVGDDLQGLSTKAGRHSARSTDGGRSVLTSCLDFSPGLTVPIPPRSPGPSASNILHPSPVHHDASAHRAPARGRLYPGCSWRVMMRGMAAYRYDDFRVQLMPRPDGDYDVRAIAPDGRQHTSV
jgi:hypothetical protein